jgi:CHAT domain-containing protein
MYKLSKTILLIFTIVCAHSISTIAQTAQERFDVLFEKGDALYYSYEYEEALSVFKQTLEIAINNDLAFKEVYNSLYSITLCYQYSNKYQLAINNINYTLENYAAELAARQIAQQYYLLGTVNSYLGKLENALAGYDKSIEIYKKHEYTDRLFTSYIARGITNIELDNYDAALTDLQKAETLTPENNSGALSNLYRAYFSLYQYMGNSAKGVPYLQESYELALKTSDKRNQLDISILLANNLMLENQYGDALKYANDGLVLAKQTNSTTLLSTLYDIIGRIYMSLNEFEQSVLHFNKAIEISREIGAEDQAARLEITIASIALKQGDAENADFILSKVNKEVLSERIKILLLAKQAEVFIELDDFKSANDFINEALNLASGELVVVRPLIYKQILRLPDKLVSQNEKLGYARKILASSKDNGVFEIMKAEMKLAELFEPINADSAFFYAYKSLEKLENRRLSTFSSTLKNSLNANWQHFYYQLADWEIRHNSDNSKAFTLFERAKSRALFDQIYGRRFFSFLDAENPSSIKLLALQKKIDRFYLEQNEATIRRENDQAIQVAALELEYQSLQDEVIQKHPEIQKIVYPNVATLKETQALLDNKTAIISYGISHNQLYIYLVKNNDILFIPLKADYDDIGAKLSLDIESFRNAIISQFESERLQAASNILTNILFTPIEDKLSDIEHLIIIPDGPLHLLPFEALRINDEYLIERFAIKYIPSVSVLSVINERQPIDFERSLLGLASSGFESGDNLAIARSQASFSTLPYTLAEIDSIQTNFPESKILKNEMVTEAAFKALDLSEYRFMHFATHGNINESVPDQSGLILSKKTETETLFGEDGYLNAREISQLSINANLVVLSACNTGVGRIINGEGVMGLQRSFLAAGASSVMVSLWSIFDRSTPIFMNLFYENLLEIEDDELSFIDKAMMYANLYSSDIVDFKTLALQQTKKQMIEHPYYNHPVHWAPFILTGK